MPDSDIEETKLRTVEMGKVERADRAIFAEMVAMPKPNENVIALVATDVPEPSERIFPAFAVMARPRTTMVDQELMSRSFQKEPTGFVTKANEPVKKPRPVMKWLLTALVIAGIAWLVAAGMRK